MTQEELVEFFKKQRDLDPEFSIIIDENLNDLLYTDKIESNRKAAFELINEYYYTLPNNGYLNSGINSCEARFKEAIKCALISVKRIILTLEFMSIESNVPTIMGRINFYDEVQSELYKIQAERNKTP